MGEKLQTLNSFMCHLLNGCWKLQVVSLKPKNFIQLNELEYSHPCVDWIKNQLKNVLSQQPVLKFKSGKVQDDEFEAIF